MYDLSPLKVRSQDAWGRLLRLDERRTSLLRRKGEIVMRSADVQSYLDCKDEVTAILDWMHAEAQKKTRAVFERLLTQLLREVMPLNCDEVVLEASVKSNRSALEFLVRTAGGHMESIFEDKGDSISNIIAMGLRFIVLSQTSNRPILLLDEADCWLNSAHVPAFAAVMSSLAKHAGVQVIYISHNDPASLSAHARMIHLEAEGAITHVASTSDCSAPDRLPVTPGYGDENCPFNEGVGLRHIRLVNFRRHENSFIELSPRLNVLTGANDIGKSTVIQALQAVVENRGREALIRHGAREARVEIGLEDGLVLVWTYRRAGSPKTSYTLYDNSGCVIKNSDSSDAAPDWLHSYLAMAPVNGNDIHFARTDNIYFLLGKSFSAQKRAEMLALGDEDAAIQRAVNAHASQVRECRGEARRIATELAAIKDSLMFFHDIDSAISTVQSNSNNVDFFADKLRHADAAQAAAYDIDERHAVCEDAAAIRNVRFGVLPDLSGLKKIQAAGKDLQSLEGVVAALHDVRGVSIPDIDGLPSVKAKSEFLFDAIIDEDSIVQSIKLAAEKAQEESAVADHNYNAFVGSLDECIVCHRPLHKDTDGRSCG